METVVVDTFTSIIAASNEALKQHENSRLHNKKGYNAWEIVKLQVLFEQLVLFPIQDKNQSVNYVIHDRLLRFKCGKIRELYHESRQVKSKSPGEQSDKPVDIQRSAQAAADLDNFKTANARVTKHAPVALINDSNVHVLENLHPPSLRLNCVKPNRSTRNGVTKPKVRITPANLLKVLSHLNKGKAPGVQCDSLDIYSKVARRLKLDKPNDLHKAQQLAGFFNKVINGDIPDGFQVFFRHTYLVALEKDPDDKTKLRPLGVPAAIRRIAAVLVLSEYSSQFAEHLLPFNFAVGVNGGIDVITKTIQLAIDKYIIEPEQNGQFPSRALVSLDIKNMFNAVSRERLRQVIAEKFPSLEAFADLIYEEPGKQFYKWEDGSWSSITVEEGFSQGCPASPVFAAIVLHEILSKIYPELLERAKQRKLSGDDGDDGMGGIAIIMGYVDDVNSMLYLDDVDFFLRRFEDEATPEGAVLNTTKTRILTTTTGVSLVDRLKATGNLSLMMKAERLFQAISRYSTTKVDGASTPLEVTDGLRVLGVPIGSPQFCKSFLNKALLRAENDANALLTKLDDLQTTLRIFSMCTAHKITHLFGCDVYNTPMEDLPTRFYLWDSPLTQRFSEMTANLLANITNRNDIPTYSQVISSMSIQQGGLGIQNPRPGAIISYMMTSKRCLQYVHDGIWLGFNKPRPILPPSVTCLYTDWKTSSNRSWMIFRKYLPVFNSIATGGSTDNLDDFVFKASLNGTREKAKNFASQQLRHEVLENDIITPEHVKQVLPGILDKRVSLALMTMSRIHPSNRIKNDTFTTALKRKLRLPIRDDMSNYKCKCNKWLDKYGDHCLGCTANHKSKASNGIRDEFVKVFQRILPIAKLVDSGTQIETEIHNIIPSLPRLKPFDLSIRLDNSLDSGAWRTPFNRIGFDVTLIHSTNKSSSTPTEAAQYSECALRLREGEKIKFARRSGGTNTLTQKTLTADEVIGEILDGNNSFVPIAIGPFGDMGSLIQRFLDDSPTLPLPTFSRDRPNATRAAERAVNFRTPYNVLGQADKQWKHKYGNSLFDGSYLSNTPSNWANQRLGLAVATHLANHINTSLSRMTYCGVSASQGTQDQSDDDASYFSTNDITEDWKYFDEVGRLSQMEEDDDVITDTLMDLGGGLSAIAHTRKPVAEFFR